MSGKRRKLLWKSYNQLKSEGNLPKRKHEISGNKVLITISWRNFKKRCKEFE